MVTETSRRAATLTALLMAKQSAYGTIATDFSSPTADTARLWTAGVGVGVGRLKKRPQGWMTTSLAGGTTGSHSLPDRSVGAFVALATPESLEMLLRSNWGAFAVGSFTLASQVNEYFTLGWVESRLSGSTQKLVRVKDAWCHELTLRSVGVGRLTLEAQYAARTTPDTALNSLGAIVLPSLTSDVPPDVNLFSTRTCQLIRDPLGANVDLRYAELELTFRQQVTAEHWMTDGFGVHKKGLTEVELAVRGYVSDETWAILNDNRSDTKRRFRLVATAPSPAKTLQIDLYEMNLEVGELGHRGPREYRALELRGVAAVDSSSNFVTISLT